MKQFLNWIVTIKGDILVGLFCIALGWTGITYTSETIDKQHKISELESKKESLQSITKVESNFSQTPNDTPDNLQKERDNSIEITAINSQIENIRQDLNDNSWFCTIKETDEKVVRISCDDAFVLLFKNIGYSLVLFGFFVILSAIARIILHYFEKEGKDIEERKKERLHDADSRESKATPIWNNVQSILESYYRRNLSQVHLIFVVSIIVMIVGFTLVASSVVYSFQSNSKYLEIVSQELKQEDLEDTDEQSPNSNEPERRSETLITFPYNKPLYLAVISGIITEFIGATFLIIYRSTIKQAIRYTESLERVNSVGMAIQILDSANDSADNNSEEDREVLTCAKIEIAKLLIEKNNSIGDRDRD